MKINRTTWVITIKNSELRNIGYGTVASLCILFGVSLMPESSDSGWEWYWMNGSNAIQLINIANWLETSLDAAATENYINFWKNLNVREFEQNNLRLNWAANNLRQLFANIWGEINNSPKIDPQTKSVLIQKLDK